MNFAKLCFVKRQSVGSNQQKGNPMARGGTNIFCPRCKSIKICGVVPLYQLKKPKARNWQRPDHHDVQWFRRARRCTKCGYQFLSAELSERFVEELVKGRELLAKKNRRVVREIYRKSPWLHRKETIPFELAKKFTEAVMCWDHPSGNAVSAPRFSNRIFKSPVHGWALELGANTILIGKTIERCKSTINRFLERATNGQLIPREEMESELKSQIRGSVANINGEEYNRYPESIGRLQFGTIFLDLADAVRFLIRTTEIKDLCVSTMG